MGDCLVCERIRLIQEGNNPYFVRELETGCVVIGDHQHFRGYTLFLCRLHVRELHELPHEIRLRHLAEMALVTEAVHAAFRPGKMNCELLGNGDAHVHWHLFPRNAGDTPKPGPVWWLPPEEMWSDAKRPSPSELEELKLALSRQLERLLNQGRANDE